MVKPVKKVPGKKVAGKKVPANKPKVPKATVVAPPPGGSLPHEVEMVAMGGSIPPLFKCARTPDDTQCIKLFYNRITGRWDLPQGGIAVDCSTCTHFFGEDE